MFDIFGKKKKARKQAVMNAIVLISYELNSMPGMLPDELFDNQYFVGYLMGVGNIIGVGCGYKSQADKLYITSDIMKGLFGESIEPAEVIANSAKLNPEKRILEKAFNDASDDMKGFFDEVMRQMSESLSFDEIIKRFDKHGLLNLKKNIL